MLSNLMRRPWVIAVGAAAALVIIVVVVLVINNDGDNDAVETATTTTEATTTTAPETTTTAPAAPTYPLTGMPIADPAAAARPALVVKIDNAQPRTGQGARPQAGINAADVVYEEMVEGSVTRFAVVYHSTDAEPIGPVRSARTTDLFIMGALNQPLFAWSGANADVAAQVRASPLVDVGVDVASGPYYRDGDRPAPYNLFASTAGLRGSAPAEERPPPALFAHRAVGAPPEGGRPVAGANIVFGTGPGSAPVGWAWDGAGWARTQRGEAHVDAAGARLAPPNVIIQFTPYVEVACCDAAGFPLVEAQLIGEGDVWVLTGGVLIEGRWSKPALEAPTVYTDAAGQPIRLTPGQTWVALAPPGTATVS